MENEEKVEMEESGEVQSLADIDESAAETQNPEPSEDVMKETPEGNTEDVDTENNDEPPTYPVAGEGSAIRELASSLGYDAISEEDARSYIVDEIESLREWKDNEMKANEKLIDLLNSEPDFRDMIKYIFQGASFSEAVAMTLDIESMKPMENTPDYARWNAAKEKRKERLRQMQEDDDANREWVTRFTQNQEATRKMIDDFASSKGMDEGEKREFIVKLAGFARDIIDFKITEDVLDMLYKAGRMEEIIEEAREEGAIDERNRKIETMRMKKGENDGLPSIGTSSSSENVSSKKGMAENFFADLIRRNNEKNN